MKHLLLVATAWLLLAGIACADPPVACNATGSQGAVTKCNSSWTYGCSSGVTSNQILAVDGQRNSIQFQNTGTIPIVLVFGDSAAGNNGFVVQPGNSYLWSNVNQGNIPGKVATTPVSINSNGASSCAFMFTD
jgi:hypothetical protein